MRVVIDTNVLISAILKDRDPEAVILYVVANADIEWMVSPKILNEYKAVLRREKFGLPKDIVLRWSEILETFTTSTDVNIDIEFPRDRNDAIFLECALSTDANFLITGDKDFADAQRLINTTIISVSQFKKLVCLT